MKKLLLASAAISAMCSPSLAHYMLPIQTIPGVMAHDPPCGAPPTSAIGSPCFTSITLTPVQPGGVGAETFPLAPPEGLGLGESTTVNLAHWNDPNHCQQIVTITTVVNGHVIVAEFDKSQAQYLDWCKNGGAPVKMQITATPLHVNLTQAKAGLGYSYTIKYAPAP